LEAESLLMTRRAKTFAWSALFLPKDIKDDLNELYSFCRYVDDCADDCTSAAEALECLDRVSKDLVESHSNIAVVERFIKLSQRRNIPIGFALELVRGVKADLGEVRVTSVEELLRYAYQVAGTVGVMICHLLAVTDKNAIASGIDLAIAMQLTNIARDVDEDLKRGRVYIPATLIKAEVIEAAFAKDQDAQRELLQAVSRLITMAGAYYRSSDSGICYLPPSVRLGILVASRSYEKIGQVILQNPSMYFQSRVTTSNLQKLHCLGRSLVCLISPRYHRAIQAPLHRSELHRALIGLTSFDGVC